MLEDNDKENSNDDYIESIEVELKQKKNKWLKQNCKRNQYDIDIILLASLEECI